MVLCIGIKIEDKQSQVHDCVVVLFNHCQPSQSLSRTNVVPVGQKRIPIFTSCYSLEDRKLESVYSHIMFNAYWEKGHTKKLNIMTP